MIADVFHHVRHVGGFFSLPIHGRSPTVERLFFHLPNECSPFSNDDEDIDSLLSKAIVKESIFSSWMEANKIYVEAKNVTYSQIITKQYLCQRCWKPWEKGYTIRRLIWVPPSIVKLFYLRMMFLVLKDHATIKTSGLLEQLNIHILKRHFWNGFSCWWYKICRGY